MLSMSGMWDSNIIKIFSANNIITPFTKTHVIPCLRPIGNARHNRSRRYFYSPSYFRQSKHAVSGNIVHKQYALFLYITLHVNSPWDLYIIDRSYGFYTITDKCLWVGIREINVSHIHAQAPFQFWGESSPLKRLWLHCEPSRKERQQICGLIFEIEILGVRHGYHIHRIAFCWRR